MIFSIQVFPKFLIRPESLKVGVGQKAHFECKVAAHPGYKRIWQKTVGAQTSLMYSDPLLRTLIAADGSLTIENVQKEDEARYVCTVISGEKAVSATARLTVSGCSSSIFFQSFSSRFFTQLACLVVYLSSVIIRQFLQYYHWASNKLFLSF